MAVGAEQVTVLAVAVVGVSIVSAVPAVTITSTTNDAMSAVVVITTVRSTVSFVSAAVGLDCAVKVSGCTTRIDRLLWWRVLCRKRNAFRNRSRGYVGKFRDRNRDLRDRSGRRDRQRHRSRRTLSRPASSAHSYRRECIAVASPTL